MAEASPRSKFNFLAFVTIALGTVYVAGLLWALINGKLDVQSFISGIGPSFGLALGHWFRTSTPSE